MTKALPQMFTHRAGGSTINAGTTCVFPNVQAGLHRWLLQRLESEFTVVPCPAGERT